MVLITFSVLAACGLKVFDAFRNFLVIPCHLFYGVLTFLLKDFFSAGEYG